MTIAFRPAVRENVGLIVGLAGGTGSGKTYTAMRLATGIARDKPFAVIDTESRRALHYADAFRFEHAELRPPFRPDRYAEAIQAADAAGYPVIVVDSMSHEWSGDGGILDWQEEEYQRLGGREATKLLSWSVPKQSHKKMVSKLLQVRAHLILCFRAEPHVEMVKEDGKTKIVPKTGLTGLQGWFPVTEKNLPFELTASFLLTADAPGIPKPIKLQQQHKALFPLDKPITEESGRLIAQWAAGGIKSSASTPANFAIGPSQEDAAGSDVTHITASQAADLTTYCADNHVPVEKLCEKAGVPSIAHLTADGASRAKAWADRYIDARNSTALKDGR
ncbi:MAG TPA: AAA family ATPase [Gemmatimonadaceae bacterium]|nr:AAA family ATPase [Gemmatimonadaceae bacterium]